MFGVIRFIGVSGSVFELLCVDRRYRGAVGDGHCHVTVIVRCCLLVISYPPPDRDPALLRSPLVVVVSVPGMSMAVEAWGLPVVW